MSDDGLKLCKVAVLAGEARRVSLAVPLNRLERIAPQLIRHDGVVTGTVALAMEKGRIVAEVELAATLELRCQRCLQPMTLLVESQSQVALVGSEEEAADVPPELETALAPDGRMRLADLIEEELLLALPAAPRHPRGCPDGQVEREAESFAETVQRPFADLGALLKPGRSKQ
ncbi:MAG: YceD family protein [Pseudomonadota bacterium]